MVAISTNREFERRPFVLLVGATEKLRASICYAASGTAFHIEPVGSVGEFSFESFASMDVLLAWADGASIERLTAEMTKANCWAPILAIGEKPSARDVVEAMTAGAVDFIDWPCDLHTLQAAITSARNLKAEMLPRKQRQIEARRALLRLSPREHEILMALVTGMTNKAIAESLQISHRTVEIHRSNLMHKLRANNTADAVRLVFEAEPAPSELQRAAKLPVAVGA